MRPLFLFLCLISSQLLSSVLHAQGATVVVSGRFGTGNASNGKYSSVTAALAQNPTGLLRIDVEGMTHNGTFYEYSENLHPLNTDPSAYADTFPIDLRSGVEVRRALTSTTIVAFSTNSGQSIFRATGNASTYQCRLDSLFLYKSTLGFEVLNTSSGTMNVECVGVSFTDCVTGLRVSAGGGSSSSPVNITVEDCWVRDYLSDATLPVSDIGLEFIAIDSSGAGPGRIDATVINLRTMGGFDGTDTAPNSKLIKIFAEGSIDEHTPNPPGFPVTNPIAQVLLDIQGGLLEGHNKDGGWRTGIFANAKSSNTETLRDYSAGYKVSTSGLIMEGFMVNAIEATVSFDARGEVSLNGGTKITNTNDTSGNPQAAPYGTGVYCHNVEGYLALRANLAKVAGNATHGILLDNEMTSLMDGIGFSPEHNLPEGLYLSLEEVELSGNQGDGLHARVNGGFKGGVVGGTRYYDYSASQYYFSPYGWGQFPNGQGRVVRSAVHNNYGKGVSAQVYTGAGSFRVARSVLWNNWEEGWRGDLFNNESYLACPIVFSTLAGNGENPAANASVALTTSSGATPNLQLQVAPNFPKLLHTKFLHSIFARKNQSGGVSTPDFGGNLNINYFPPITEEDDDGFSSPFMLRMTGCRSTEDLFGVPSAPSSFGRWISFQSLGGAGGNIPFVGDVGGSVVWTSDNPEQFRFGNISNHAAAGVVTNWLGNLYLPASDFGVDLRNISITPGFTGLDWNGGANFTTNKGAFED